MFKRLCYVCLISATLAFGCGVAEPQPGVVTGTVRGVKRYDSTKIGPPLVGREITLLDSDTGNVEARTRTDANGKYRFSVAPGKYSVWGGEHADYVKVTAGSTNTIDILAPED
jgi:hypothetical protein